MGDKHSVSAETGSSSPPLSLSSVNVRRSVSPPTNISLEACGAIYDERVNGNVSPSQVRKLGSQVSPKDQRTMSPTQDHGKLSPVSLRDDVKLSPTSSTQSVPCQGGSSAIGVSRKFPHGGGRCTAGACLARAALTSDPSQSCQHTTVCDMAVPVNGDTQKDSAASHSNNSQATKSPVSSPKVLSPVVHVRNGDASHPSESHLNLCDAVTNNDIRHKSLTSDSSTQAGATKPTSPSDAANLAGRGCVDVATPFHALPPPYRVTRTGSSPIAPHRGQSSPSDVTQQENAKKMEPGNDMTNGLPTCPLTTAGTSFVSTAQCQPTSPGSSVAGSIASFSFDGGLAAPGIRQKQTLGELLQQVDVVSRALRSKGDFTCPDFLPDLQFLAHQSRYNSDAGIKRRIISRLVDAGILEISIKVFWFLSSVDYLGTVAMATTMTADHNDNVACMDESTESIPMLLVHGRLDHRRALMKSQGKVDSIESEGQSQVSMTDVVKIVHAVITCLQCTTERSAILCEGCVRRGLMQMMLLELADPRLTCTDPKDQCKVYVVKGFLSVLGNIIRNYGDGRFAFRLAGALRVLQLHLKSPLLPVKIKTVILLSYVVTETENEIVNATDKHIGLVVKMLQTTVDSNNHYSRKYGFSTTEAVAGLNRLGCYELNKERMAKCGAVSLYSRLLQREVSHEEQLLAVRGVWTLAFHQGNRRQLQQDDACLQALQYLEKEGTREEIRSSAKGALWVICGRNMFMKDVIPVSSVTAGDYHVMVSYQWSSRVYVARLCDRLQAAGCRVWLDLEHKGGAPVEIMKEAVEKASMVLMCMSQKYKDSPSCRTEAEYVEHSRRPLIPVCIQPHFTPDGWLTTLLSDKFVYNFSHESYITLMLENLLKDISCCGGARAKKTRSQTENLSVPATVANIPSSPPLHDSSKVRLRSEVSRWTTKEVMDWLTSNDLHPVAGSFEHVNGELLEQVRRLQVAAPDTFYAVLKRDLGLGFIDILKFTAALEKLPWSSSIS